MLLVIHPLWLVIHNAMSINKATWYSIQHSLFEFMTIHCDLKIFLNFFLYLGGIFSFGLLIVGVLDSRERWTDIGRHQGPQGGRAELSWVARRGPHHGHRQAPVLHRHPVRLSHETDDADHVAHAARLPPRLHPQTQIQNLGRQHVDVEQADCRGRLDRCFFFFNTIFVSSHM